MMFKQCKVALLTVDCNRLEAVNVLFEPFREVRAIFNGKLG